MKDWDLARSMHWPKQYVLIHVNCKKETTFNWTCTKLNDGHWQCGKCYEPVPEEMEFVADLARCRSCELRPDP